MATRLVGAAPVVAVSEGGTGLSSGTSGGVLAFTASGTLASSAALVANQLVVGGGAGVVPKTVGGSDSLGVFGVTAVARQVSGANLTNNVTSGGTDDVIADYSDLTVYATDAAAIRNNFYQLARKLKQVNDALRAYGFLT